MADSLNLLSGGVPDAAEPVAGLNLLADTPVTQGPFRKGFGAGVEGVRANLYGAGALAAHAVGANTLEQTALEKSAAASARADAQSQSLEQVDWSSPASIADHFKYLLGNAVPSLALMAAGGGIGGVAAKGLGALAGRAALSRAGALAGAVIPDVALEAGGIYPEALKTGVENPAARAAVGGAAAATLDFIPLLAAEKYLAKAGKGGFGAIAKGAAKGAPVGAALEGTQELAQSVIERAAAGQSLTDPEAISDYINSFAGGAVPGSLFGAGIGGHRGAKPAPVQETPPSTEREQPALLNAPAPITPATGVDPEAAQRVAEAQARADTLYAERDATEAERNKFMPSEQNAALPTDRRDLQGLNPEIKPSIETPVSDVIQTKTPTDEEAIKTAVAGVHAMFKEHGMLLKDFGEVKAAEAQTPRERALEIVNQRSGRKVDNTPSEQTRQGAVETAAVEAAAPAIKAIVDAKAEASVAKNFTAPKKAALTRKLTDAMNSVAQEAAALPTTQAAQQHIGEMVPRALKGHIDAKSAAEVTATMINAVGQAHTLYSKGATEDDYKDWKQAQEYEGRLFGGAYNWTRIEGGANGLGQAAKDAPMRKGIHLARERYNALRVKFGLTPISDWKIRPGRDQLVQYLPDPRGVHDSKAGLTTEQFAALPQVAKNAAVDTFNGVMARSGTAQIDEITRLLGDDPSQTIQTSATKRGDTIVRVGNRIGRITREDPRRAQLTGRISQMVGADAGLSVNTFTAAPGEAIGGYTRLGPLKSLISLALNAKSALSVADHEAFHYAEDRLLNSAERAVVRDGLRSGSRLFKQLIEKVQAYDRENKTRVADEVLSNPAEAHAYGFEFWKRGELQVQGALARIFAKLRAFFDKIADFVKGQGFQSIEDVFTALDRGEFANREKNEFSGLKDQDSRGTTESQTNNAAGQAVESELPLYSKAALQDIKRRVENGELEREQVSQTIVGMIDQGLTPVTAKQALGAVGSQFLGSLKRWRLKYLATGNYISQFSKGYANVQKTLLAYVQRKSALIAEGSLVQLSSWHASATSQNDITAVGDVLLERTDKGLRIDSPEYTEMTNKLTPHQRTMLKQATDMIAGRLRHEFAVEQKSMQEILPKDDYAEWFANRSTQVDKLIEQGYVPERRYGDHTVHIYLDREGKGGKPERLTVHYEQYENQRDADLRAQQYAELLKREAPELKVESAYRYKVERDASISIQQFLDTARRNGVEITQAERERLAKALVAADSARRNRMFRRKNIPGYSRDIMRVLHEFVVTTANKVGYAEFSTAINDAIEGKPVDARTENGVPLSRTDADPTHNLWQADGPQRGFYRNISDELVDYVLVPDHGGNWSRKLRGAAMTYFIGGSLASGVVNAMSIPMNTVPWLSQSTGYANAMSTTLGSMGMVLKNFTAIRDIPTLKNKDIAISGVDEIPGLRDALITAAEDGRTMDTEIHQIMGMAQGASYAHSRKVQKAMEVWMAPFRLTEQGNRLTTFVSAYRIGRENNLSGRALYDFAAGAVDNTQNRYDEVNRPGLARDPVWALLFMFKSFPLFMIEMIETMYRQNPKSAVYMLLGLVAMTGVQGMPFAEPIEDLIDTIAQRLFGSPFNTRRAMRNLIKDASEAIVGADLSELVLRGGINASTGMSVGSRIGLGDFVPGTRIGAADNDYGRTAEQILGAPFSMVVGTAGVAGKLMKGDFVEAMRAGGPTAIRNLIKGGQQLDRGYAEDARGRKLVDVTGPEAFWQSAGFSSAALSKSYEMDKIDRQTQAFYVEARNAFTDQMVKALKAGDAVKAQETQAAVQKWNEAYPDEPIGFNASTLRRDIVNAGLPLNERTQRMLPKHLRGTSFAAEGIK